MASVQYQQCISIELMQKHFNKNTKKQAIHLVPLSMCFFSNAIKFMIVIDPNLSSSGRSSLLKQGPAGWGSGTIDDQLKVLGTGLFHLIEFLWANVYRDSKGIKLDWRLLFIQHLTPSMSWRLLITASSRKQYKGHWKKNAGLKHIVFTFPPKLV